MYILIFPCTHSARSPNGIILKDVVKRKLDTPGSLTLIRSSSFTGSTRHGYIYVYSSYIDVCGMTLEIDYKCELESNIQIKKIEKFVKYDGDKEIKKNKNQNQFNL